MKHVVVESVICISIGAILFLGAYALTAATTTKAMIALSFILTGLISHKIYQLHK
mgnify:FL=1|jgi:hypothetical protein